MFDVFFKGILLGLGLSASIGPAFFGIIQTGVSRGKWYGVAMAFGILLSDITLISLCLLGLSSFINNPDYKLYVGLIGGIILILYGINTFISPPKNPLETQHEIEAKQKKMNFFKKHLGQDASWPVYVIKGYFMNLMNPFLLFFWLTAVGTVGAYTSAGNEIMHTIVFFAGTLSTIFFFDVLKAYLGHKVKKFITYRLLVYFNKIVGITLAGFGVYLIVKLFI